MMVMNDRYVKDVQADNIRRLNKDYDQDATKWKITKWHK